MGSLFRLFRISFGMLLQPAVHAAAAATAAAVLLLLLLLPPLWKSSEPITILKCLNRTACILVRAERMDPFSNHTWSIV